MIYLLILHIGLGASLLVTFIFRGFAVFTAKISRNKGRQAVPILGAGIVISGTALSILARSPISSICLSSISIIAVIIIAEYVLQRLPVSNK
jgi:putative flippase GtrA